MHGRLLLLSFVVVCVPVVFECGVRIKVGAVVSANNRLVVLFKGSRVEVPAHNHGEHRTTVTVACIDYSICRPLSGTCLQ